MNKMFNFRRIGNTDLMLSPIGLGSWQFSGGNGVGSKFWNKVYDKDIKEIIAESLKGGINWIDTAEAYGRGYSERIIAKSLDELYKEKKITYDPYIADKWWPLGRTAKSITSTIEKRRAELGGRMINIYQIHHPTSFSSIKSQMKQMQMLVRNKDIKYVGVSNFSAKQMKEAYYYLRGLGCKLVSNQVMYNLYNRNIERNGVLDIARELGISIIAYSPLHQGLLTGKFHDNTNRINKMFCIKKIQYGFTKKNLERTKPLISKLKELGIKYNKTPAQIAINWIIYGNDEIIFTVSGASKSKHVKENIGSMDFVMEEKDIKELGNIKF